MPQINVTEDELETIVAALNQWANTSRDQISVFNKNTEADRRMRFTFENQEKKLRELGNRIEGGY